MSPLKASKKIYQQTYRPSLIALTLKTLKILKISRTYDKKSNKLS